MQWGENNLTWDDYYERFYDLSLSTQKSYSYKLTNYGDAEEVFEVLSEFAFYDKYLLVGLHTSKDLFSICSLKEPVNDGKQFFTMFEEILSIIKLIDHFKLNQKIGL